MILPTDNTAADKCAATCGVLEPGRLALRLSLHRAFAAADRRHRRIAAGRLSNAVSQREHDGLDEQQAQRALLGAEADQGYLPSRRQTGGDQLAGRRCASDLAAQAFVTPEGRKAVVGKQADHAVDVTLPDAEKASALTVDVETGDGPARSVKPADGKLRAGAFAVTVVSW